MKSKMLACSQLCIDDRQVHGGSPGTERQTQKRQVETAGAEFMNVQFL